MLLIFATALWLAALLGGAQAQSYPDRPVRCVVAFAAGGPSDIIARLVCAKMAELTGKTFYVDNVGGGGGNIGMGAVARAQPDGLTMIAVGARRGNGTSTPPHRCAH